MNIIQEINEKIKELQEQKKKIQQECSHPKSCLTNVKYYADEDEYGKTLGPGSYGAWCGLCEASLSFDKDPRR